MVRSGSKVDIQAALMSRAAETVMVATLTAASEPVPPAQRLLHITHARQDEAWVHGVLIPALGLAEGQFWTRAEDDLGALKLEELERAVVSCRYTLLVASSAARVDQWTQLASMLAEHLGLEEGKPRLLVVTRDFEPGSERAKDLLPLRQRCLMCLDGSDPERSAAALAALAAQLALTETEESPTECPYPGLRMFGAGDPASCFDRPDLFFGRDDEGRAIVTQLRTTGRALLVGPSGCGKSSLVRARVLPAFDHGADATAVVRPHMDADAALRAGLESIDPQLAAATDAYLAAAGQPGALTVLMEAAAGAERLVYVDQLEEVFRDDNDENGSRAAFFARLSALAHVPGVALLLAMRADFYGDLMRSQAWDDFKDHRVELTPLRGAALREAIVRPAERVGVHVEVDLVERLVREAEQDRAAEALPLLQVALEQLWAQREWRYLSLASYARIIDGDRHGLDAVLARHADDSIVVLAEPQRVLARRVLIDLVHLGEGRPDTRRRRNSSELRRSGDDVDALERVLAHLSARRLIAVGAEAGETPALGVALCSSEAAPYPIERHVDLAHDTLITGWPALAGWIAERRDDLRTQRQLEARAATGGLLSASELPEFTRWVAWIDTPAGQTLGATESLRTLVRRSVAARRLRRRAFAIGLTGAVTFAIVFWLQTVELRDERTKTQRSISKAAETAQMVVFDVEKGLRTLAGASDVREKVLKRTRDLLAELRKLGKLTEDVQRTGMMGKLAEGDFALERGRLEEAHTIFQEVRADAQRRAATDVEDVQWQSDLAVAFERLGRVATKAGQLDIARGWFEQSLVVRKSLINRDPDRPDWQRDLSLISERLGDVAIMASQLGDAQTWFEQSLAIRKRLTARKPSNMDWQSELSTSYSRLGDVAVMAGRLDEASGWFEQDLAVRKTLVSNRPNNADWQRHLSCALDRLGDIAMKDGRLEVARKWYEQALAVSKVLAAKDPNNIEWRSDLAVSYDKLGDVASKADQVDVARAWFEQTLVISKALAAQEPTNTKWQRNVSVALMKLGDVTISTGQLEAARNWVEQAFSIGNTLTAKDPDNTEWQRDLMVFSSRLGDIAVKAGQLDVARAWFERSLAMARSLARDPQYITGQADLSYFYTKLGDVAVSAGQFEAARTWFEQDLAISKALVAGDPNNTHWQNNLLVSYSRLGDVAVTAGKFEVARASFERSLAIGKALATQDPGNAEWQYNLAAGFEKLGSVAIKAGQFDSARPWFQQAHAVREKMIAKDPNNAELHNRLALTMEQLGDIACRAGQLDIARVTFEQLLAIRRELTVKDSSNAVWQMNLGAAFARLGELEVKAGHLEAALARFEQALGVARTLAAQDPANAEWQRNLAAAFEGLGDVAFKAGDLGVARAWFEQALAICESLASKSEGSAQAQYDLMGSLMKLASAFHTQPKRAAHHIERVAVIHAQLRHDGAFEGDPEFVRIGKRLRQLRGR